MPDGPGREIVVEVASYAAKLLTEYLEQGIDPDEATQMVQRRIRDKIITIESHKAYRRRAERAHERVVERYQNWKHYGTDSNLREEPR